MSWRTAVGPIIATIFTALCATCAWATPDACSLLTQSQVSAALGIQVGPGEHIIANNPALCGWSAPGHNGPSDKKVVLSMYTQLGRLTPVDGFNTAKKPVQGIIKKQVSGVGDDAVQVKTPGFGTGLIVRKGNEAFDVRVYGFPDEQVNEKAKILARNILSKL